MSAYAYIFHIAAAILPYTKQKVKNKCPSITSKGTWPPSFSAYPLIMTLGNEEGK
jgi:hypothetical protein